MPLTPETITKHELAGLRVRVASATNPSLESIEGRVVSETMNTLTVESASRSWQVPKQGTTFEFELTDEAAASVKEAGTASKRGRKLLESAPVSLVFSPSPARRHVGTLPTVARAWLTLRWMARICSHDPHCVPKLEEIRNGVRIECTRTGGDLLPR